MTLLTDIGRCTGALLRSPAAIRAAHAFILGAAPFALWLWVAK